MTSNEIKAMSKDEIKEKIRSIIGTVLDAPPEDIPETPDLPHQLFLDSLLVLEILVQLENEFQVPFDDDSNVLEFLDSLDAATSYVEAKLSEAA